MPIRWKNSCRFDDLHPAMILAVLRAEEISYSLGVDLIITSANDSAHLPNSKHYSGKALDFRTKHLTRAGDALDFERRLKIALGPQYTVILEDLAQTNEHLHVQFNGQ